MAIWCHGHIKAIWLYPTIHLHHHYYERKTDREKRKCQLLEGPLKTRDSVNSHKTYCKHLSWQKQLTKKEKWKTLNKLYSDYIAATFFTLEINTDHTKTTKIKFTFHPSLVFFICRGVCCFVLLLLFICLPNIKCQTTINKYKGLFCKY